MGLFLKQNEQRSQLQSKIAADLQERIRVESLEQGGKKPRPAILDNQHQTSSLAWVWILLGVVAIAGVFFVLTK